MAINRMNGFSGHVPLSRPGSGSGSWKSAHISFSHPPSQIRCNGRDKPFLEPHGLRNTNNRRDSVKTWSVHLYSKLFSVWPFLCTLPFLHTNSFFSITISPVDNKFDTHISVYCIHIFIEFEEIWMSRKCAMGQNIPKKPLIWVLCTFVWFL